MRMNIGIYLTVGIVVAVFIWYISGLTLLPALLPYP